ncbi:MAG: NusA-like transcription termination signal-binding factor [Candidatus Lokiarchaeota archaeon]|nr:NusA-like transcription termination signal-binding factor [Candidatus Lokiarchaeota archaeon]MBD3338725.1 NusA-like transcription termination signal-binding factor [Candidatus Lokiarchaeota archaeon]
MLKKNIKIDRESMELISLFNNISGAIIKDCLTYHSPENHKDIIIFLVKKRDVGKAIGKAGEHVKDLTAKLQKKIDVIPFSNRLDEFIQFILNTAKNSIKVENIEIKEGRNQKKTVIISVRPQDRGKAIGKDGSMIKKIKKLVLRHFEVDNVIINTKN